MIFVKKRTRVKIVIAGKKIVCISNVVVAILPREEIQQKKRTK